MATTTAAPSSTAAKGKRPAPVVTAPPVPDSDTARGQRPAPTSGDGTTPVPADVGTLQSGILAYITGQGDPAWFDSLDQTVQGQLTALQDAYLTEQRLGKVTGPVINDSKNYGGSFDVTVWASTYAHMTANTPPPAGSTIGQDPSGGPVQYDSNGNVIGGGGTLAGSGIGANGTKDQRDALTYLKTVLGQYGLGGDSTVQWAWNLITSGVSDDEIMQQLRGRDEYKQRFAGMDALSKKGRAITEAQYIDLERSYTEINRMHGLTPGAYDSPQALAKLIGGEVSATEWDQRLTAYDKTVGDNVSPEVRQWALQNGLSKGDLTTVWMDPNVALTTLEHNEQMAQIGGAYAGSGMAGVTGGLGTDDAARLADLGVTADQATAGFGRAYANRELTGALPGTDGSGSVTTGDLIGATLGGDAAAAERADTVAARRRAEFQRGGGFAATQTGVAGLGSTNG